MPYLGYRVPFTKQHKKDAKIKSIAVDSKGNIYLKLFQKLSPYRIDSQGKPKPILPDASIENGAIILNSNFEQIKYFKTSLKKGFEKPKSLYLTDRSASFENFLGKLFYSIVERLHEAEMYSCMMKERCFVYYPTGITISPDEKIYVPFKGDKRFGVIDAAIFDLKGRMVGYWKQPKKSYRIDLDASYDEQLHFAFYDDYIFVGKTFTTYVENYNIIQKYILRKEAV